MTTDSTANLDPRHWNDEREFKRRYPLVWAGTLFGPPLFAIGSVLFFWIAYGWESAAKLATTALVSFFLAGKMIILGGGIEHLEQRDFYSSEQLLILVTAIDLMTVCFLVFHLGFLFKIPKMGSKLQMIADNGHMILDAHPWMRRATFVGLVVFVAVPLAMTGSVGGSILGRMLGMSRLATFAGVMLGNFITCATMYFGSELLRNFLKKDNPWLLIGGILVMGGILYILLRRYQLSMKRLDKTSPP